jgi:hypothetical protein
MVPNTHATIINTIIKKGDENQPCHNRFPIYESLTTNSPFTTFLSPMYRQPFLEKKSYSVHGGTSESYFNLDRIVSQLGKSQLARAGSQRQSAQSSIPAPGGDNPKALSRPFA